MIATTALTSEADARRIGKEAADALMKLLVEEGVPEKREAQHATYSGRAEMQTGPTENLGNLDLTHRGAQHLEPPNDVAHQLGELVDRLSNLNQRPGPSLVY